MTKRILIVEDEFLLADTIADAIAARGGIAIGPAFSLADAMALVRSTDDIGAAILDVNLRGEHVTPVAEALRERGTPFVLTTGYDVAPAAAAFAGARILQKPFDPEALAELAMRLAGG